MFMYITDLFLEGLSTPIHIFSQGDYVLFNHRKDVSTLRVDALSDPHSRIYPERVNALSKIYPKRVYTLLEQS